MKPTKNKPKAFRDIASVLSYNPDLYTVDALKTGFIMDKTEMRREYARLRKIALKRLDRLSKSKYKDSDTYRYNKNRFNTPQSKIKDHDLPYQLADLARFLESKRSTVTGAKQEDLKKIESLNNSGYTFINKDNLAAFGAFMDEYRARKTNEIYDSDSAAKLFDIVEREIISPEQLQDNFDKYLEHIDEIEKIANDRRRTKKTSSDLINRKLESW